MPMNQRIVGRRLGATLILAVILLFAMASPAAAHTSFESSSPADGLELNEPVDQILVIFLGEATPTGDGFVVLDADGLVRIPDEISSTDNLTWTLQFNEPLAGGTIGVRWKVAAPDAHPIEGSFSFTVNAPAIAAVNPTTATPIPAESSANESGEIESSPVSQTPEETSELADFLDVGDTSAAGVARVGDLGRAGSLIGVVLAFGGVVFAALTLRGDRSDIRAVLFWVRRAGLFVMLSVVVESAAQIATLASGWSGLWSPSALADALGSSFGFAVALRLTGGALITSGARLNTHLAQNAADPVVAVRQLAAVGAGLTAATPQPSPARVTETFVHHGDGAWHISKSPAAFAGAVLLAMSFLFDGHTVSAGPRWLHAVANAVHVTTAATWAGGVVMLALVIARRHRRNADTRALQLAVRFSVVASITLVGAAVTGIVMTVVILDSVTELWSTPWGRLLVAKVLLVGIAVAGGGYNHRIVIPALELSPNNDAVARQFRSIVTLEAVALVSVALITGLLIAASST